MTTGVLTESQLAEVVKAYMAFDEFVVDVETKGPHRGDPHRNDVFWISLAGPGRADAIPCGHPLGERVVYASDDETHRVHPTRGKHQERRVNETTGRLNWTDVPEQYTEPPVQMWISDVVEALKPLFFSGKTIIGHNVKFDLESLAKYWKAVPDPPYADTYVAHRLIDENALSNKLGDLVNRYFSFRYQKIGSAGPDNFPFSEAALYSYYDAKYTWLLWQRLYRMLDEQDLQQVFKLEMDLLPVLVDMEITGIPVDRDALAVLGHEFSMEMAKIQVAINKKAGNEVNLNANRQVADFVYGSLGHECPEFTATGERSTARATLENFAKDDYVAKILDHAKLRKLQGTFIDGISRNLNDGRIHPSFNQVGAVSGRLSCSNPNIQQIPSRSERGKRVREVFTASPGHVLVVSDLSQIELRVLAHMTKDELLVDAYTQNVDLHGVFAERVFGPSYTPAQRSLAKNTHFSVLYGAGPETMVRMYGIPSVKIAKQLLKGFYEAYPNVQPWKDHVISDARNRGRKGVLPHVTTLLGRKRRLPALSWLDQGARSAAERQAVSVTISGSAADLFKIAMIQCDQMLLREQWEGHILMTVHDELVVEIPEEFAEDGLALVKHAMEEIANPFTGEPMLSVPIVADAKIVDRWSEAK